MDDTVAADVQAFRHQVVARTLRPLLLVLALLYGMFLVLTNLPDQPAPPATLAFLWGASASIFALAFALWPRFTLAAPHAHTALAVIAGMVMVNSTALLHSADQAFYGFVLAFIVLGFSVLALSIPWFLGLVAVVELVWLSLLPSIGADPYTFPMTIILTSAAAIALLNQVLRVRQAQQMAVLRRQEREAEHQRIRAAVQRQELDSLRTLDAFKNRFLNSAAHELGTPLTPIKVQIHLLRARLKQGDTAQREAVEVLERNVARLEEHVHQLLDAARVQTASLGLAPAPINLRRLLQGAVAEARGAAEAAQLQLVVDEGPDVTIPVDEHRMRDVLGNLLENAIKFTPAGGVVRISSEHQPNGVRIRIQDTGVGLSADQLQKLFIPYEQLHETAHLVRSGVGLGLYISRAIVQLHGGQLWARSLGAGRGAEFMVDLPLAGAEGGTGPASTGSQDA